MNTDKAIPVKTNVTAMDALAGQSKLTANLRRADGSIVDLDGQLWVDEIDGIDADVLTRAHGPVIDIGCGPGRHTHALAQRGEVAMGIDLSPHAVAIAREKGIPVLERSIFDRVPRTGEWACALLLDGNIGIGGDPASLLKRVNEALRPGGSILIEVQPDVDGPEHEVVRLEINGEPGPWFPWANVDVAAIKSIANDIELNVAETWQNGGRHFVHLTSIETI